MGAEQEHQTDIAVTGRGCQLDPPHAGPRGRERQDIRIDAGGANTQLRDDAVHGFQRIKPVVPKCRWGHDIGSHPVATPALAQFDESIGEDRDQLRHGQNLLDILIRQDECHGWTVSVNQSVGSSCPMPASLALL